MNSYNEGQVFEGIDIKAGTGYVYYHPWLSELHTQIFVNPCTVRKSLTLSMEFSVDQTNPGATKQSLFWDQLWKMTSYENYENDPYLPWEYLSIKDGSLYYAISPVIATCFRLKYVLTGDDSIMDLTVWGKQKENR